MAKAVNLFLCGLLLVISSGWSDCTSVSIVLSSADENVTVRSTVLLVCVAYGGSIAPSVVWYRNGRPITNDTDVRFTVYDSTTSSSGLTFAESILEICSIGLDEGGDYTCNASSSSGDSSTTNTTTLTVLERGEPDRPCNCSSVPVYSEAGTLISIEFNWTKVANPPVVIAGVNPDITSYDVSVNGLGAHIIPAESVCMGPAAGVPDSQMSCSYSYPVPRDQNFMNRSMNRNTLQVAAVNEIGRGRTCSPSHGQMNSYKNIMMLSIDTTERSVTCTRGRDISEQSFRCEFCYATDDSCQDQAGPTTDMMSCSSDLDNTRILATLSEGTYCYRATAVVDGTPNVVVQDTFNIRQQAPATGGNNLVPVLAGSVTTSFIAAFIIGLLVGSIPCLCYYRGRSKHSSQRVCLNCTNSGGIGGGSVETKDIGLYEAIPGPTPQKEKDINISTNEAYGKLPNMNSVW